MSRLLGRPSFKISIAVSDRRSLSISYSRCSLSWSVSQTENQPARCRTAPALQCPDTPSEYRRRLPVAARVNVEIPVTTSTSASSSVFIICKSFSFRQASAGLSWRITHPKTSRCASRFASDTRTNYPRQFHKSKANPA